MCLAPIASLLIVLRNESIVPEYIYMRRVHKLQISQIEITELPLPHRTASVWDIRYTSAAGRLIHVYKDLIVMAYTVVTYRLHTHNNPQPYV